MRIISEKEGDIGPLLIDTLPARNGLIVMLKAYLDRGEKVYGKNDIMSVACVIFKPTAYKQFIRPWNRLLKQWGATAFHATDFYNGAEEFKRDTPKKRELFNEHSRLWPQLVGRYSRRIYFVSFIPSEFAQVAPQHWTDRFGTSLHSQAVQLIMIANGWWRNENCKSEHFAYFIETGDPDQSEVLDTMNRMKNDLTGTGEIVKTTAVTAVSKGRARGTEAADFVSWHWNKYQIEKLARGKIDPRKDFVALDASHRNKIGYIFASGDKLKFLFSLVSQQPVPPSPEVVR